MKERLGYILSTTTFSLLAVLSLGVFITSLGKNAIDMCVRIGWDWRHTGNYVNPCFIFLHICFHALSSFCIMPMSSCESVMYGALESKVNKNYSCQDQANN